MLSPKRLKGKPSFHCWVCLLPLLLLISYFQYDITIRSLRDDMNENTVILSYLLRTQQQAAEIRLVFPNTHKRITHLLPILLSSENRTIPDYGGLVYRSVPFRNISQQGNQFYVSGRTKELEVMNVDKKLSHYYLNDEDFNGADEECQRNNWRSKHFPVCNNVHESPLHYGDRLQTYNVQWRGAGTFRMSWLLAKGGASIIYKVVKFSTQYTYKMFYQMHLEAIIMERLTKSPRIVSIYGFCGTTIFAEPMAEEVTPDIIPGKKDKRYNIYKTGFLEQEELDKLQTHDVHPMNNLTLQQKLDYATVMAESIADIHGFEGGVIVHGDIHPVQWLRSASGRITLNDFNNADILNYDQKEGAYCRTWRCYAGTFRPPEEIACRYCDEQVDTYSMGNNIYTLLTGLWPYYQYGLKRQKIAKSKLLDERERPFVDPRYRKRSDIEGGLVKIMEQCWEWDPQKRVSIFGVVKQLYDLKKSVA
jgi:serine/threonine protein kinase